MDDINKIELSFLNHNDVKELCGLYIDVFNRSVDPSYFVAKYGLDFNVNQFSVVARQNHDIVGFFGCIEQFFAKGYKQVKMVSCGDYTLTKRLRGKNIFDQLYHKVKEKAESENLDYLYAFQSDQTYKVAKKWGWKDEVGMKRAQIDVYPISTFQLLNKIGLSSFRLTKLENELTPFLINKFDVEFKSDDTYIHEYDEQFFNLKEFAKHYWVEIAGCVLALKYEYRITVGFIQFSSDANVLKMLAFLKKVARKCLIHEIVFHVQENSSEAQRLAQFMPLKKSFQVSSFKLNERAPSFSEVKLNFMDMDIF